MKKYSELTIDIKKSIASAYDLNLPKKKMEEVKSHLAYILPRLHEPNTLINQIKEALAFIHEQEGRTQSWKDWLVKPVLVAIATGLITAPISFYVGITIEKSKAAECEAHTKNKGITNQ
ncbi:hypothetical protein [Pseudomonas sp. TCU-HL1]|uniref:hypothetical protein n=1 Tax=Pseudomonas sp. TCU-HL1 TaxID=1856685 RepID=UPI000856C69F|nr:hypothetical protein [Pseudomonas sp. TCU-HL1]AOE87956.1 hypothetical protein THL1_5409 [Pseudomonas sp. TCU-HL1]